MSEKHSLADKAVNTISAVIAMTDGLDNEHFERHVVRNLKREAEAILDAAFLQARGLAYIAEDLREEARKHEALRHDPKTAACMPVSSAAER